MGIIMKLTNAQLKQIILEELRSVLREWNPFGSVINRVQPTPIGVYSQEEVGDHIQTKETILDLLRQAWKEGDDETLNQAKEFADSIPEINWDHLRQELRQEFIEKEWPLPPNEWQEWWDSLSAKERQRREEDNKWNEQARWDEYEREMDDYYHPG